MKEKLRSVYRTAKSVDEARILLVDWTDTAKSSEIPELKTMSKTITLHLEGILGYWKDDKLTNAGMEGFNDKVRWLISQAYGYHDQEYLRLKIHDLPACKTIKEI